MGKQYDGARLANGGRIFHQELEEKLAAFPGKEACHAFSAGYLVRACRNGIFRPEGSALRRQESAFFLWSGIKLSGARYERFAHNNPAHSRNP